MKTNTAQRQYRSNMEGAAVRMGVAEGAEAHIMAILTDMYGDPELACIREYATNARDSHIEAGQTRPIEVTLPTPYLPTLVIRDYGIGLDAEGIIKLYSQYGASTKRDTNDAQGMLGIGCKSALAYTDQFTVVGYKDGVRTQVVISRDEDGAATQTIVGEDEGDHENGVEVTIPVRADNDIKAKATEFFKFWPPKSVLLNGEEPARIGTEAAMDDLEGGEYRNIWLDDSTLLTNEVQQDLVVMGYVAYPLVEGDDDLFVSPNRGKKGRFVTGRGYVYDKTFNAVCFVDIGDVDFAPSRESLRTTKRTKERLEELRKHIAESLDASVRAQIAGAKTAKEAQDLMQAGFSLGWDNGGTPVTWQGREVMLTLMRGKKVKDSLDPTKTRLAFSEDWPSDECLRYSYLFANVNSYSRKQGERAQRLDLKDTRLTIFHGFDTKWLTNVKRAKLELWAQNKGLTIGPSVFVDKLTKDEKFWTDGWAIYDWAEVEATELPKTITADGSAVRLKGSYDALVDGQMVSGVPAHKIDSSKPLYYVHGNYWTADQSLPIRSGAIKKEGCTIIALSMNRIEKFRRDFPMAVEIHDAARAAAKAWEAKIDPDQVKAHAVREHRARYVLQALKGEDFDDPTLNTLIRLANTDDSKYREGMERFAAWVESPSIGATRKLLDGLMKKYPLWPGLGMSEPSGTQLEHIVLYLNAAIAAKKGA